MIKLHPNLHQLQAYVAGDLNPAQALIIAAHCDMCACCQSQIEQINDDLAQKVFSEPALAVNSPALQLMMEHIMALPELGDTGEHAGVSLEMELDGKFFPLPRALTRFVSQAESWSRLLGKLWQTQVDLGDGLKGHFIYMEKGGKVPEHTHKGLEMTLVLDGEFEDEKGLYKTGDFITTDANITHTPQSNVNEGCLVFSVVEQPLHFTSGLARLLNPFSHLFFK